MKRSAKLTVAVASTLTCFGVAEVIVRTADLFADERAATREHALDERESDSATDKLFLQHPYLGYAGNPDHRDKLITDVALSRMFPGEPSAYYLRNSRINAQGFPSEHADYLALQDGFNIAVCGGSVAEQLATVGGETLIAEVERRLPGLQGRVRVLNLSIGGYKQPQQLINLMLMDLQGVRLDVVVNLDGFNEVALSASDMVTRYNPVLPSRWHYLLMLKLNPESLSNEMIERYAQAVRLRRSADTWRRASNGLLATHSELARALLGRLVVRRLGRANRIEYELQRDDSIPAGLSNYEPPCLGDEENQCWELIADVWEKSSLQMGATAELIGAQYLHFLQPNQYLESSKPLTAHEKKIAYTPEILWARAVRKGYPLLKERIPSMATRGVVVHDLTSTFADFTEDIYIDTCCHYNLLGTNMIATAIAERVQWDGSR